MEGSEMGKLLKALLSAAEPTEGATADGDLRSKASSLRRVYRSLDKIQAQEHNQNIMQAASQLWNKSLSETQGDEEQSHIIHRGSLKQAALELWSATLEGTTLPLSQQVQLLECGYQTAELWAELDCWEEADAASSLITSLSPDPATAAVDPKTPNPGTEEDIKQRCARAHCQSEILRLRILLHLGQELPAGALLVRLKALATNQSLPLGSRVHCVANFMNTAAREAVILLSEGNKKPTLAAQLLQAAHEAHGALTQSPEAMKIVTDSGIKDTLAKMGFNVLLMLATAHLRAGNATEKALQCVEAFRRLNGPASLEMMLYVITHEALLQTGRVSEAETELLRIVTHEGSQPEISAQAIKAAMLAPGGAAGARAALATVLEHVESEEGTFALDLASAVLGIGSRTKTATHVSPEAEDVILELFSEDRVRESLLSDSDMYAKAHAVLYNYAICLSETSGRNEQAVKMYAAAVSVLPDAEHEKLYEGYLSQAMCFISLGDFSAAAKRLEAAEECMPGRRATAFLSFKCAILAKDEGEATIAMYRLAEASNDTPDVLRLACCEAMDAGADGVAINALTLLLEKASDDHDAGYIAQITPGYESVISQNLIAILERSMKMEDEEATKDPMQQEDSAAGTAAGTGEGGSNSGDTRLAELACCLDRAVTRMRQIGVDIFFINTDGRYSQLQWMAQTAWNAGKQAAEAGKLQAAAVLFGCGADLYAGIPSRGRPDTLRYCHSAYIMAAAAVLEEHNANPEYTPSLNLTEKRLREARAVEEGDGDEGAGESNQSAMNPKVLVFSRILEFDLAIRRREPEAAVAAVASAQSLHAVTAEHFIKMAGMCQGGPYKCEASARAALQAALQSLTSQPTLNYAQVAAITRFLAELAPTDADRLRVLHDAAAIVAAAPQDSYPSLEARWLVTCAWNRGATHAKFGRAEEAEEFMGLAMKMVVHADMEVEKEKMQHAYAEAEARLRVQDKPGAETQAVEAMEVESN